MTEQSQPASQGGNGQPAKRSLRALFSRAGGRPSLLTALWGSFGRFVVLLILVGLVVFAIEYYRSGPKREAALQQQPAAQGAGGGDVRARSEATEFRPEAPLHAAEENTVRSVVEGRASLARAKREELLDDAAEANKRIDEWVSEIDRLEKRTSDLLDGEDGKAVAGDRALVSRFITATDKERSGKDVAQRFRSRLETLLDPVRAAQKRPLDGWLPDEILVRQVRDATFRATVERDELRSALIQIDGIVATAKKLGVSSAAGLRAAVVNEKQARAEAAISAADEAERAARERGVKKVAEERAKAAEAVHESEAARVRQEAALKKAEADRELAGKKAAEDKAKRKKELTRRMDDVKRYLAPFTGEGTTQPKTTHDWEKGCPKGPVSFSRLESLGCLKKNPDGLEKLALVGCRQVGQNDRERWGFFAFRHSWDSETSEFVRNAQALLIELGQAMVEAGILAE